MEIPKMRKMGAIIEPRLAEMREEELGELGKDEVLIKMLACNICTTDYQQWLGLRNHMGFPMAAGHEWSGDVIAVGENVKYFKVGDRVAPGGGFGCGVCEYCRTGRHEMCIVPKGPHPMVNGYRGGRGFSNFRIAKQSDIVKMNKEIPPEICAFLEPVSAATGCASKARVRGGENVVVVGIGTMGLLVAQVCKALGARVIVSDISAKKLGRARESGLFDVIDSSSEDPVKRVFELTDGVGADVVIPCIGNSAVYAQAYQMLRQGGGRYILFAAGYPAPELKIDPNKIHYGRTEIIGTIGSNNDDLFLAAKLINTKSIDPSLSWEGEKYPLRDIQKAYEAATQPDKYRVSVELQEI